MSEELCLYFPQSDKTVSLKDLLKDKDAIIAGRIKPSCDLELDQHFNKDKIRWLSRKHFMIYQRFSQLFIEDLGSTHGTELDGKKLSPGVGIVLHPGRTIRLAQDDDFLIRVIGETVDGVDGSVTVIDPPPPPKKESGLDFDEKLNLFSVDGEPIHHLSQMQENLLTHLYKNAGRSCPYHELNKYVWYGNAKRETMRTAVHILRGKLDEISLGAGGERYIKTLHGYGYKLIRK